MNNLGNFFQEKRINQGLTLGQLARMVGYGNISKGANKICRFEREGIVTEDLLATLAEVLGIDFPTVENLVEKDRQEHLQAWEKWVSEPVPMRLVVRYIPAVYATVPLPKEITTPEQAEVFACEYAKKNRHKVCLAVSRRLSIWIDEQGQVYSRTEATPDESNVPYMQLKGSKKKFLLGFDK